VLTELEFMSIFHWR